MGIRKATTVTMSLKTKVSQSLGLSSADSKVMRQRRGVEVEDAVEAGVNQVKWMKAQIIQITQKLVSRINVSERADF